MILEDTETRSECTEEVVVHLVAYGRRGREQAHSKQKGPWWETAALGMTLHIPESRGRPLQKLGQEDDQDHELF